MQNKWGAEQVLRGRVRGWGELKGLAGHRHLDGVTEATIDRFRLLPRWQRAVMLAVMLLRARAAFGTGGAVSGVADRWIAVSASSAAVQLLVADRNRR